MRWLFLWGSLTGLLISLEVVVVAFRSPGPWLAPFSLAEYLYLVGAISGLVLALRRGSGAWFFAAYVVYAVGDGLYGFYLVRRVPDPEMLRLPGLVLAVHFAFGLAYALWGGGTACSAGLSSGLWDGGLQLRQM